MIRQDKRLEKQLVYLGNKEWIRQMRGLLSKVLLRIQTKIYRRTITYKYNKISIQLPAGHSLPVYQKYYPQYDKFLPILSKHISKSSCIVDIGANVGDTLAGMIEQNPSAQYICIEADETFYKFLVKNVKRIKEAYENVKIETSQNFIGASLSNMKLEGLNGTKHAVASENNGGIASITLDVLLPSITNSKVGLLKTDVDGFDYDVLDSAFSTIRRDLPLIFFELYFENLSQKDGYIKTISSLKTFGYCDWTIFDNFGGVIIRTSEIEEIFQLMDYVENQNVGLSSRTIYYFDILAAQKSDSEKIDSVFLDYT